MTWLLRLAAAAMAVGIATGGGAAHRSRAGLILDDQVAETVIPQAPFQAVAAAWGAGFVYGGPANCMTSPPGVQVVCVVDQGVGARATGYRRWLGGWMVNGGGIIISPRLIGRPALVEQVVSCEMGNAMGKIERGIYLPDCGRP